MAWRELISFKAYTGTYFDNGNFYVGIEYDDASITITSVKLRSKGYLKEWSSSAEGYFITDKEGTFSRLAYRPGTDTKYGKDSKYYYYSNSFSISKDPYAESFSIPELYVCHDGQHHTAATYTDSNWRGHSAYFTSGRTSYKSVINSGGTSLNTSVYVNDVGTGTTTITDNLNNSFTITATKGANGTNNTAGGPTDLKWGYTTAKSNTYTNDQTIALTRETPSNATRTVYAESTTTATYGDAKIATASKAINQYYDPGDPGVPALTESSFKNGRLTIKQNWQYLWTPAQKRGCSDVRGYRIRVYKNSSPITGLTYDSSSNTLGLGTGTNEFVDTESTNNSITFNPATLGFKPKDTIKLHIHAYSRNAHEQQEWTVGNTPYRLFSAAKDSATTTVQNAGIVRVKVGNEWKEGQVWVKTSDGWKEAETVNIKTSAGWKESQ